MEDYPDYKVENFEHYISLIEQYLKDEDYENLSDLLTVIQENLVKVYHLPEFVQKFFPEFYKILSSTKYQFHENSQQECRRKVLEVFRRIPYNDHIYPEIQRMIDITTEILQHDNEDNAVICIKTIMSMHKKFVKKRSDYLRQNVQVFLDFVKKLYSEFREIMDSLFYPERNTPGYSSSGRRLRGSRYRREKPTQDKGRVIAKSTRSTKVLTECPLLVVFLFQAYQDPKEDSNLLELLENMIRSFDHKIVLPPKNEVQRRAKYTLLVSCQVKTASFLAYTLRVYNKFIKNQREVIPKIVTDLLLTCPPECIQAKKELLVILRHMIDSRSNNLRIQFITFIDKFLNDRDLVGTNRISYDSMRPLAYSTLADLIHHVRNKLSLKLISKTVTFYTRVMYDHTLKMAIQTMSAKLLVHLVESIFISKQKAEGRKILLGIMEAFINKVKSLSGLIVRIDKNIRDNVHKPENLGKEFVDYSSKISQSDMLRIRDRTSNVLQLRQNCKTMVKTLILGLKNVVYVIHNLDREPNGLVVPFQRTKMFKGLFKKGLLCFTIYEMGKRDTSTADAKENLEAFSSLFTVLSRQAFCEIVSHQIPFMYRKVVENRVYLQVPKTFLACSKLSRFFSHLMLKFLMQKLDILNRPHEYPQEGKAILKFYKLIFMSVTNHPKNENVIRPHLIPLVKKCVRNVSKSLESVNYLHLLRTIFRSLLSRKLEALCDEILPYIHIIVEKLDDLLRGATKTPYRDLVIELCLTIPAKSHILCPYVPLLIRPVLYALEGSQDLVQFGFRQLDSWVNTLGSDTLEPILKPIMPRLLSALFLHLKPKPYQFGATSLKVLAKIIGYSKPEPKIYPNVLPVVDNPKFLNLELEVLDEEKGTRGFIKVPMDDYLKMARKVIFSSMQLDEERINAIKFQQNMLMSLLDVNGATTKNYSFPDQLVGTFTQSGKKVVFGVMKRGYNQKGLVKPKIDQHLNDLPQNWKRKSDRRISTEESTFRLLLSSIIETLSLKKFTDICQPFVSKVLRHYSIITISLNNKISIPGRDLDVDIFLDTIINMIMMDSSIAILVMKEYMDNCLLLCQENKLVFSNLRVWEKTIQRLSHCCYQRDWKRKVGGCKGLKAMCEYLPISWVGEHQRDIVNALLFSIKTSPTVLETSVIVSAKDTLMKMLEVLHVPFLGSEIGKTQPFGPIDESGTIIQIGGKRLDELFRILVKEINHENNHVRKVVVEMLDRVHSISRIPLGQYFIRYKSIFSPVLERRKFETLSLSSKIGFCESMSYFLRLQPTIIPLTLELSVLGKKVLKTVENLKKNRDRRRSSFKEMKERDGVMEACLTFLGELLNFRLDVPGNVDSKGRHYDWLPVLRKTIMESFFILLGHKSEVFVEICKKYLKNYIRKNVPKLPKDTLKNSLRNHLSKLGKHTNITRHTLTTLKHLLELCTTYFSPKLFMTLYSHLEKWRQSEGLRQFDSEEEKVLVGAKMLGLFHLLPIKEEFGNKVGAIIQLVQVLENTYSKHCTVTFSDFRKPLCQYLSNYANKALSFFLLPDENQMSQGNNQRGIRLLDNYHFYNIFLSMIQFKEWFQPIQMAMRGDIVKMCLTSNFNLDVNSRSYSEEEIEKETRLVSLFREIVKYFPDYLRNCTDVISSLLIVYRKTIDDNQFIESSNPHHSIKIINLLQTFMSYYDSDREVEMLFQIALCFTNRSAVDLTFVRDYFRSLVEVLSNSEKAFILEHFIKEKMEKGFIFDEGLCEVSSQIIVPCIDYCAKNGMISEMFNQKLVSIVINFVCQKADGQYFHRFSNGLNLELLKIIFRIVKYVPKMVEPLLPMLRRYYQSFLQIPEVTFLPCVFAVSSLVIDTFGGEDDEILDIYERMLKTDGQEGRRVISESIDRLLPSVIKINKMECGVPKWVKITHRKCIEGGYSVSVLNHLWGFLLRHGDLFYPYRDLFIMKMVNSLGRIGTSTNLSFENRKLSLDIANLALEWQNKANTLTEEELKALEENKVEKKVVKKKRKRGRPKKKDVEAAKKKKIEEQGKIQAVPVPSGAISLKRRKFPFTKEEKRTTELVSEFVLFVIRIIYSRPPVTKAVYDQVKSLSRLSVNTMYKALSQCNEGKVVFEKIIGLITSPQNEEMTVIGIRTLSICARFKKHLIWENIKTILKNITPLIGNPNVKLVKALLEFINAVYKYFTDEELEHEGMKQMTLVCWDNVKSGFVAWDRTFPQAPTVNKQTPVIMIYGFLRLLSILCDKTPNRAPQFVSTVQYILTKLLQNYMRRSTAELAKRENQEDPENFKKQYRSRAQLSNYRKRILRSITMKLKENIPSIQLCIKFLSNLDRYNSSDEYYSFLLTLSQILDKADFFAPEIIQECMNILGVWILKKKKTHDFDFSLKQKTYFLQKMSKLGGIDNHLQIRDKYYSIIRTLYSDDDIMTQKNFFPLKIECLFLSGVSSSIERRKKEIPKRILQANDVNLNENDSINHRNQFIDAINNKIGNTLFERLCYICQSEHWEYLRSNFWISVANDILLKLVNLERKLEINGFSKVPSFGTKRETLKHKSYEAPKGVRNITPKIRAFLEQEENFLHEIKLLKVKDIVLPIKQLIHENVGISKGIWVSLFSGMWSLLSCDEQLKLQKPFLVLLARDYHSSQYVKYPNVIQALLEGMNGTGIPISPDQLRFLGKSFNCWNIVLPMIEKRLHLLLKKSTNQELIERYATSATELFKTLNEDDFLQGVWRCFGILQESKHIFTLNLLQDWRGMQDYLNSLFKLFHEGHINRSNVYHPEISLWEDMWLKSSKKLLQWEDLFGFSQHSKIPMLSVESLWNLGKWKDVNHVLKATPRIQTSSQSLHLFQIGFYIMENRISESIEAYAMAINSALQRWCALPNFHCQTHELMIQQFQLLCEMFESTHFLADANVLNNPGKITNFLSNWNKRIPDLGEDISLWSGLLMWRFFFLEKLSMMSNPSTQSKESCSKEASNYLFKLSKILRKKGMTQTSRNLIKRGIQMSQYFKQLTESPEMNFQMGIQEVKMLIQEGKESEALELMNNGKCFQNISLNKNSIQMLNLRGKLLTFFFKFDEAGKCFSQAVSLFPEKFIGLKDATKKLGSVFFSWGRMYDLKYCAQNSTSSAQSQQGHHSISYAGGSRGISDAEQAVSAYLQGIRFRQQDYEVVPRIIYLMTQDPRISNLMSNSMKDVPIWVFLPWFYNFVMLLSRENELKIASDILLKLGLDYPQGIYCALRANFFKNKIGVQGNRSGKERFKTRVEIIMTKLLALHTILVREIEGMLKDCYQNLTPSPLEELLRCIELLLENLYSSNIYLPTPLAIRNQIIGIREHFFEKKMRVPEQVNNLHIDTDAGEKFQQTEFFKKHGMQFRSDLLICEKVGHKAIDSIVILKKWIVIIHMNLENLPLCISLEKISQFLISFKFQEMEVPGHYLEHYKHRPFVESHERLLHFLPEVEIMRRNKINCRVVNLRTRSGGNCKILFETTPRFGKNFGNSSLHSGVENMSGIGSKIGFSMINPMNKIPVTLGVGMPMTMHQHVHMRGIGDKNKAQTMTGALKTGMTIPKYFTVGDVNMHNNKGNVKKNTGNKKQGTHNLITQDPRKVGKRMTKNSQKTHQIPKSINNNMSNTSANAGIINNTNTQIGVNGGFVDSTAEFMSNMGSTEERTFWLIRHINYLIKKYNAVSSKKLYLNLPTLINVYKQFRMIVLDSGEELSLNQIYSEYCSKIGKATDDLYVEYWNELYKRIGMTRNLSVACRSTFLSLKEKIPDDCLKKTVFLYCPSWHLFFQIRKAFGAQIGLYGIITHVLDIPNTLMENYYVSMNSGRVHQFGFIPKIVTDPNLLVNTGLKSKLENKMSYNSNSVPFRLTQNLVKVIDNFGIEGVLLNSMTVIAYSLWANKMAILNECRLFVRDELIERVLYRNESTDNIAQVQKILNTTEGNLSRITDRINSLVNENEYRFQKAGIEYLTKSTQHCTTTDIGKLLKALSKGGYPGNQTILSGSEDLAVTGNVNQISKTLEISNLIERARSKDRLSQMTVTWCPFF